MSGVALRKLKKEYTSLAADPPSPGMVVRPLESNFLHAHFLLSGESFYDTPYEGGHYHGLLKFPKDYPFKPPSIIMRTPSGRFKTNERICFSMSDFHPECWQPSWTTRTILNAFVSFMNGDEITTGGIDAPSHARGELAKRSLDHCLEMDDLAKKIFGDVLEEVKGERRNGDGDGGDWPPRRPTPKTPPPPPPPAKASLDGEATKNRSKRGGVTEKRDKSVLGSCDGPSVSRPQPQTQPQQQTQTSEAGGKNAAKNKKKREKEKKKKVASKFLSDLREELPGFVSAIVRELQSRFDVASLRADHVCYRTDSIEQYDRLVNALRSAATSECELLVESNVGGRSIATFKLLQPIEWNDEESENLRRSIDVVEIPAPKDGRPYRSGLEHVEFIIGGKEVGGGEERTTLVTSPTNDEAHALGLRRFMETHPLPAGEFWDTKALGKDSNPDISLKVNLGGDYGGMVSAKFHLMALEDVIRAEKKTTTGD